MLRAGKEEVSTASPSKSERQRAASFQQAHQGTGPPATAGLGPGSPTYCGGRRVQSLAQHILTSGVLLQLNRDGSTQSQRLLGPALGLCLMVGRGTGNHAGRAGMLEGGAAGQWRPTLPARPPLPSHALASCPAEQTQIRPSALGPRHGGQPATLQGHGDIAASYSGTQVHVSRTEISGQLCSLFLIFC